MIHRCPSCNSENFYYDADEEVDYEVWWCDDCGKVFEDDEVHKNRLS